jgi:hypothetical protein
MAMSVSTFLSLHIGDPLRDLDEAALNTLKHILRLTLVVYVCLQ